LAEKIDIWRLVRLKIKVSKEKSLKQSMGWQLRIDSLITRNGNTGQIHWL
jgi:hypothetical protein